MLLFFCFFCDDITRQLFFFSFFVLSRYLKYPIPTQYFITGTSFYVCRYPFFLFFFYFSTQMTKL